ncbi:hypothetical protein ACNKHW_14475 [Shigella flexneri]
MLPLIELRLNATGADCRLVNAGHRYGLDTLDLMQAPAGRRWPGSTLPVVEVDALEQLL